MTQSFPEVCCQSLHIICVLQKGTDYGALIIQVAAAVVVAISFGLILLVVGNMIYQSITNQVTLRERVGVFNDYTC